MRGWRCRRGVEASEPLCGRHSTDGNARLHRQQLGHAGWTHRFRRQRRAVSLRRRSSYLRRWCKAFSEFSTPTKHLKSTHNFPRPLKRVSAEVVHLGIRKRVTIDNGEVNDRGIGTSLRSTVRIEMASHGRLSAEAGLDIDRTFATGRDWTATPEIVIRPGEGIALRRVPTSTLAGLWKLDDAPGNTAANGSPYEAAGTLHGNVVLQSGRPARPTGRAHDFRTVLRSWSTTSSRSLLSRMRASRSNPGFKPLHRRTRSSPRARCLFAGRQGRKTFRVDHAGRQPVCRSGRCDRRRGWPVAPCGGRVRSSDSDADRLSGWQAGR